MYGHCRKRRQVITAPVAAVVLVVPVVPVVVIVVVVKVYSRLSEGENLFTLTKWYLDVVADDGTVVIGYSARMSWGRVQLVYGSILTSPPGGPTQEDSVIGNAGELLEEASHITWQHPMLGVRGEWTRLAPPIAHHLLEAPDGDISWRCAMPQARAEVEVGSRLITGIGYAEQLTMTLAPWRLPFRHLRWGRFASETGHVIWISWRGGDERQFVWHTGLLQPHATIDDAGVHGLADGTTLDLAEPRDVCTRPAVARIIDRLPATLRRAASPIAAMSEHKMVAASRMIAYDGRVDTGWSVFEEVHW